MRRAVAWVTAGLAIVLLAGAGAAEAQIPIRIDDARVVEQSSGNWPLQVQVRLPGPAPATITVNYATVPGSAASGSDFTAASGTLMFNTGDTQKPITVLINGDTIDEWILPLTYHQDEVFFIQLSNPSANASLEKGRATITLIDDDRPMPGLQFLSAVDGTPAQNTLQWRVPAAAVQPSDILVRWNQGVGCASPPDTVAGVTGGQFLLSSVPLAVAGAGQLQSLTHAGRPAVPHCYSLFTMYGVTPTAEPMSVLATPFDGTVGAVKWSYTPGCYLPCAAATLAPPTVGFDAIYSVDNYGVLHAMERLGGVWPSTWQPLSLGKPTQSRSAVVPMRVVPALGDWRLFIGTDAGGVHAVDGKSGQLVWSRSAAFSNALPNDGGAQAAPAGLFRNYGGNNDMILVGTNNASNSVHALDPGTGNDVTPNFAHALLGRIAGMAVVDYAGNRAFFLTSDSTGVLFGISLGPVAAPSLTLATLAGNNPEDCSSGSSGSAVLRNNRLFFGASSSQACMVDLLNGSRSQTNIGDGGVKGFMWPDRRNDNLYFSSSGNVRAVRDTGAVPAEDVWPAPLPLTSPSIVLQRPGTDYLYVGDGNGRLVQIDASNGLPINAPLVLDPGFQIGAPSLDNVNNLVVVGSQSGRIYAVRVPF